MLNNNQLQLLKRKLDQIVSSQTISIKGQNKIMIGSTEFSFSSTQPSQTISQRTVVSR